MENIEDYMSNSFEDIKIVAIDENASGGRDPHSALIDVVLTLSRDAPGEWANYFNERWHQHIYMVKRNASVSGNRLEIRCVPDELEKDHIPELKKIIQETNQAYRQHISQEQQAAQKEAARVVADKEAILNLKKNIKFD